MMNEKYIEFSLFNQKNINSTPIEIESKSGIDQSVKSPTLGSVSFIQPCTTCFLTDQCPGHFGKFAISKPIFKVSFKKEIEFLLKNICPKCGMIKNGNIIALLEKIDKNNNVITLEHRKIFNEIMLENKQYNKQIKIKCKNEFCQEQTTSIQYNTKNSNFTYNTNIKEICDTKNLFTYFKMLPKNFLRLLNPKNDLEIINPKDVFYDDYLLIPSNYIREPNIYENISFDPFTSELNVLVKTLRNSGLLGHRKTQALFDSIDNNQGDNPYSTVKKLNLAILTNGTNKDSYLRSNINGKRVINTSRGVISPGVDLNIGEINVPEYILTNLRENVYFNRITETYIIDSLKNSNNKEFLDYIKIDYNNSKIYKIVNLSNNNFKILALKYGEQLERNIQYKQYIMFGRQPSIHPWNCQAAQIKKSEVVYPDKFERTINIATPIAPSQNADYDGDEMLLKKFNNTTANIEKGLILNSKKQLKHPVTGTTMYGLVQDQIVAINLLLQEQEISMRQVCLITGRYIHFIMSNDKYKNKTTLSGREIISSIFPKYFTYENTFKNGEIIVEHITSNMVSANSYNSIFNELSHVYGEDYVVTIIDIIKKIVQNYLKYFGLSITMTNLVPDVKIISTIEDFINKNIKSVNRVIGNLINDLNADKYYISSYNDVIDIKLKNIEKLMQKTHKFMKRILEEKYNQKDNLFKICYDMGYKLPINDITSLLCFVGLKNNKQMPYPKINGKTSLYDIQNNINIESSGFITNSFLKGLTYSQYVTMVKEESLPQIVNVTSGTSQAGSAGKKMLRLASELFLNFDKYVVTNKYIVNFNPNFLKISVGDMCRIKIILPHKNMFWFEEIKILFDEHIKEYLYINKEKSIDIVTNINFYVNLYSEISIYYYEQKDKKHVPVVDHNKNLKKIKTFYEYILNRYYFNLNDLSYVLYLFLIYFDPSGYIFSHESTDVSNYFSEELLDKIFDKIIYKLNYSLSPGYMIGYYVANTLQEKFTQQTLSSFHNTNNLHKGSSEEFKQLLELSKKDEDIVTCNSYDYDFLTNIKNHVEHISLKIICNKIDLVEENTQQKYFLYCCNISVPILIQKKINLITLHQMTKTYCDRCLSIQDYFYYFDINPDIIKLYIYVKINLFYKNIEISLDILKYYFKISLWDGIHKGKQLNTNLDIQSKTVSIINDDYTIDTKILYSLKFFIENINDFIHIDTSLLESIYITPWMSFNIGGIEYMKINTLGKVNNLINDNNFIYCLKHFFDFRFFASTPTNIKTLHNKSEIIKQANNGNNNIIVHAAYKGLIDKCSDVYASLFVSQIPPTGTNYHQFYLNPNLFDKFELIEKQSKIIDDNEAIISVL